MSDQGVVEQITTKSLVVVDDSNRPVLQVKGTGQTPGMWFTNPHIPHQGVNIYAQKDITVFSIYDGQPGSSYPCLAIAVNNEGKATFQWQTPDGKIQQVPMKVIQGIIEAHLPR